MRPEYIYVASSWRCDRQPEVVDALRSHGMECYDFRNPEGGTGFSWKEVGGDPLGPTGSDLEPVGRYLEMIEHPRAREGYAADFSAMERADAFVLVLPCGRSAHLELGWAVGQGKRTAILLEDPAVPELMYRMVDHLATSVEDLVKWLDDDIAHGWMKCPHIDPATGRQCDALLSDGDRLDGHTHGHYHDDDDYLPPWESRIVRFAA